MNTKTKKTKTADAPLTRNEFKAAVSKMTRDELIGVLCDIYYTSAQDGKGAKGGKGGKGSKGSCECDCDCSSGSESKKTKTPAKVKKSVKVSKSKHK